MMYVGMTLCQEDTAGRVENMKQSSATPCLHLSFLGLRKIVSCSQPHLWCIFVSTVFGMVSSLHPTSFLYLYMYMYIHVFKQALRLRASASPRILAAHFAHIACLCARVRNLISQPNYYVIMHVCVQSLAHSFAI